VYICFNNCLVVFSILDPLSTLLLTVERRIGEDLTGSPDESNTIDHGIGLVRQRAAAPARTCRPLGLHQSAGDPDACHRGNRNAQAANRLPQQGLEIPPGVIYIRKRTEADKCSWPWASSTRRTQRIQTESFPDMGAGRSPQARTPVLNGPRASCPACGLACRILA
jgi:hypothetical protein